MLKDDWEKADAFETLSEDDARAMCRCLKPYDALIAASARTCRRASMLAAIAFFVSSASFFASSLAISFLSACDTSKLTIPDDAFGVNRIDPRLQNPGFVDVQATLYLIVPVDSPMDL